MQHNIGLSDVGDDVDMCVQRLVSPYSPYNTVITELIGVIQLQSANYDPYKAK